MKSVCFVLTTPFAVNSFVLPHLNQLAQRLRVTLIVNLALYPLSDQLDPRVRVIDLPLQRKIAPLQDLRTLLQLIRILQRERFDAIHSMMPKSGLLAMMAGFVCRVPHRFHTFTGQVWVTRKGMARLLLKSFDRLIAAMTTQALCDGPSQQRFLESAGVGRPGSIRVLGSGSTAGVNASRFKPDATTRSRIRDELGAADAFVFLFVGRLSRDKGIFDLLQAFDTVASQQPGCKLWVVGPDEECLLAELRGRYHGLASRVQWIGSTFHPENYMAAANALVLPSYREGFCMVVIEAAACAIPTIGYAIDGVTDAVIDGQTGLLVPTANIPALTMAMCRLAASPDETRAMGVRALRLVLDNYASASITAAWDEFYWTKLG